MTRLRDEHLIDCVEGDDLLINCERWHGIPGFPGYYINKFGEVASIFKGYFHVLSTWTNRHGHQYVELTAADGSRSKELVHRLAAKVFIPNPDNHPIIRHLDDVPTNNDIDNLAWGTQTDNVRDMHRSGNAFTKPVYCHELQMTFNSGADAALYFGVSRSEVSLLCSGKNKTLQGKYHLSFLEEVNNYGRHN